MRFYKVLTLIIIVLITIKHIVLAKVSGPCNNCHTMHYSQSGAIKPSWGKEGPYQNLLINDCVGCHSAEDPSTWKNSIGAPIVYNTAQPSYGFYCAADGKHQGLAGGNFWYVAQNDTCGHNVHGITKKDSILSTAPGITDSCEGCHIKMDFVESNACSRGCTCCHDVGHHVDDSGPVVGNTTGWPASYYRFLNFCCGNDGEPLGHGNCPNSYISSTTNFYGAEGIEDSDWEKTYDSIDHNEYAGGGDYKHSISKFCAVCHGDFYEYQKSGGGWYHHPTDYAIPNSGEYANAFGANGTGTGTWDPMVPVARPYSKLESMTGPDQKVNIGIDMVQCLSCHRAHASPYPSILRWDYNACLNGQANSTCGCFVCHTEKD